MTSKEMEARSGVPRANIRYYEAEGLLAPARAKNGYRVYSEADLALLEKIRLLRQLGVSVEELRALRDGTDELSAVLDRRLAELGGERENLTRVEQVCGDLREAGETFESLDAGRYLPALDAPVLPAGGGTWWAAAPPPPLPETDTLPICTSIPRRLFARLFDRLLAAVLLAAALALTGHNPALWNATLFGLVVQGLLLFVEPLLIHLFGATPGKALLGLRLSAPGGDRLTYAEAFTRHLLLLWYAYALGIPIWSWVRLYRSARRCVDGEPQPWDVDVAYHETQPFRRRCAAAYLAAAALTLLAGEAANAWSQLPPNRGDLTVAEFAENFNRQAAYMGMDFSGQQLNGEGEWEDLPYDGTLYLPLSAWGPWENIPFTYTVEEGRLTKLTLAAEVRNTGSWLSIPKAEMGASVAAFAWGREDAPFWPRERKALLAALDDADEGFTLRQGDVVVSLEIDREGFLDTDMGFLIPEQEGGENHLAFIFVIAVEE